ncbi:hypothetical protein ACFQ7Z_33085 [Streptomyces virginiae]|uniref:hypothetical protein n=1 Tax=Streptomyces virginiae TaxID=1961 RepID=UPI00367CC3A9
MSDDLIATSATSSALVWSVPRAPFVNYTSWPTPNLETFRKESGVDGFIVGSLGAVRGADEKIYWGTNTTLGDAATSSFGRQDFAAVAAARGRVILSFGGADTMPVESVESNVAQITDTYLAIIEKYDVGHVDFDLEGGFVDDDRVRSRHVAAVRAVLQARPELQISYTLPVDGAPGLLEGFTPSGVGFLRSLADAGIRPSLVNAQAMEFGAGAPADLFDATVVALKGAHRQLSQIWSNPDSSEVWRGMGVCPAFGLRNDGTFTLQNMRQLLAFATERNIGCLSGLDIVRDFNGGQSQAGGNMSKYTGIAQDPFAFCKIIAEYRPTL